MTAHCSAISFFLLASLSISEPGCVYIVHIQVLTCIYNIDWFTHRASSVRQKQSTASISMPQTYDVLVEMKTLWDDLLTACSNCVIPANSFKSNWHSISNSSWDSMKWNIRLELKLVRSLNEEMPIDACWTLLSINRKLIAVEWPRQATAIYFRIENAQLVPIWLDHTQWIACLRCFWSYLLIRRSTQY